MMSRHKGLPINHIMAGLGVSRPARVRLYHLFWIIFDFTAVIVAYTAAFLIRTLVSIEDYIRSLDSIIAVAVLTIILLQLNGAYRRIWRQTSGREVRVLIMACGESLGILLVLALAVRPRILPLSVIIMGQLLSLVAFTAVRYRARLKTGLWWRWQAVWLNRFPENLPRVLIAGAGKSGQLFASHLATAGGKSPPYKVVGFADDDPEKQGMLVEGLPILGRIQAIPEMVGKHDIDMIVLAIHNIGGAELRAIVDVCQESDAQIKIMPDVFGVLTEPNRNAHLRDIRIEDVVGRASVPPGSEIDLSPVTGKVVLVTGAAGSIGSELSAQLAEHSPQNLILLDNNESGLFDLEVDLRHRRNNLQVVPVLCDVTDWAKLTSVFEKYRPQVVFHAAAYKHVPLLEDHPYEAVRINVGGTFNMATLAQEFDTERFILISSDKAVNSTSVMGATKYLCERLVCSLSVTCPEKSTLMCVVRFGNVLGSRGSVVPLFERQIREGGPVTVTDERMTRYFMSIPEAVQLVIQAACMTQGLDLFILEMGESVRILDLAERMIRLQGLRPYKDIPITFVGMRPGETLHENLLAEGERRCDTPHPYIFSVESPVNGFAESLNQVKHLLNGDLSLDTDALRKRVISLAKQAQTEVH